MDLQSKIHGALRPSEHLLAFLHGSFVAQPAPASTSASTPESAILAVVKHTDELNGQEEGSVFVFRRKPNDALEINRIFPIVGSFAISMTQSKSPTVDVLTSPTAQSSSGFLLRITSGETGSQALQLLTHDIRELRVVLDHTKALKSIADNTTSRSGSAIGPTYSWIAPYVRGEPLWTLPTVPRDLRLLKKSINDQLSHASAGFAPPDESTDLRHIMEAWLHKEARSAASKGTHKLRLRVGTFNVNGILPSQDLAPWVQDLTTTKLSPSKDPASDSILPPSDNDVPPLNVGVTEDPVGKNVAPSISEQSETSTLVPDTELSDSDPDLIVMGFQEVDLSTEALIYSTSTVKEEAWCTAILAGLGEKQDKYEKFVSKLFVGMLIVVVARREIIPCLGEVQTSTVGAGILGFMGNKGGVGVRLQFSPPSLDPDIKHGPTTLTFVSSHLAAFDEMVDRRNQDFHDISNRLTFNIVNNSNPASSSVDGAATVVTSLPVSLFESDAVFWMGDLNYRVDVPDPDVRRILNSPDWHNGIDVLMRHDQLRKSMASQQAFEIFTEPRITHMPTYRFSPGVLTDSLGYDTKRRPAWCDRVLHVSNTTTPIKPLTYREHWEVTQSDHLPVSATFEVGVDVYEVENLEEGAKDLNWKCRGLDKEDERAQMEVDPEGVEFEALKYGKEQVRTIKVKNTGRTARAFRFISLDGDSAIHPRWLAIEPSTGIILPGRTTNINFTAHVDNLSASELNMKFSDVSALLVLHVLMGKDYFIDIRAQYKPTSLGNSIPLLTRLPGPIRSSQHLLPEERPMNAPRELMRLINWLMTNCKQHDELFKEPADEIIVDQVVECLDTGDEFPWSSENVTSDVILAVGETLRRFLSSLTEPVIPVFVQAKCETVNNRDEAFELLDVLSPAAVNVWISLTAFLHFVCESSADPEQRAQHIASLFMPILMKDGNTVSSTSVSPVAKFNFLHYFITN
ncbi:DNase I-like protein [Flagelloscypha sp. PMI_526]|nr:DNase I-like protein [Flagelloscypha sp. PMI_526]